MKKYLAIITTLIGAATLMMPGSASALSGSEFQPGRIIDDAVFFDKSAMTVQQIQDFLNAKVPTCDNNGDQAYYGYYGGRQHNGDVLRRNLDSNYPAPYTCLRQYVENTTTHDNNMGRPSASISGGISAAQIIYNEAQSYSISPKVLLVLIQKESSLVTDDWPWSNQYRSATGYGCPDTAPCDSQYYGFYNQVHNAARQFRIYTDNPNSYNYGIGNNTIAYNPNGSCGSAQVNIINQATANLYIYTPYVPNAAALNNLYGTGDSCSAYGNRNFWRQFNDWFGSTFADSYSWSLSSQTAWTDSSKAQSVDLNNLSAGQSVYVEVKARNTGNTTWLNNGNFPVRLGTQQPRDHVSRYGSAWTLRDGGNNVGTRAAQLTESSVATGGTGTFGITLTVPAGFGSFSESFNLLAEKLTWFSGPNYVLNTRVNSSYSWSLSSQTAWTDSSKAQSVDLNNLSAGQSVYVEIKARNTGNTTWLNNGNFPVRLGTQQPRDHVSRYGSAWTLRDGGNNVGTRAAQLTESSVATGGTGTFGITLTVPAGFGSFSESFNLLAEKLTWFSGPNYVLNTRVN